MLQIEEVSKKDRIKDFVRFQRRLYADNPHFVPPLEKMELEMLSYQNPMTRNCEFALWLVTEEDQVVGRIAAIINHPYNDRKGIKQARFSHFDCVDRQEVADLLLDTAMLWAGEKNMDHIIGPFGFTNLDKHGLMIEGYEELPSQASNYNFPYYQELIENYGFQKELDWLEHEVSIPDKEPERIARFATLLREKHKLQSIDLRKKNNLKKYAPGVLNLYNETYSKLYGVSPLDERQKKQVLKSIISHLHPDYVSILTTADQQVVGFGIAMPSLSESLQRAKGKLFPTGFWHLLHNAKDNDTLDLLLIGVHPDYQRKGLNAIIFSDIAKGIFKNKIRKMETNQNLESNSEVLNLWKDFEYRQHKRARLYSKSIG